MRKNRLTIQAVGLFLLYLGLGFASAELWVRIVTYGLRFQAPGSVPPLHSWHQEMISGTAPAPNQYRPLTPWLAEFVWRLSGQGDLYLSYFLLRALFTGLALWVFDRYLRVWFAPGAAAGGALALAVVIPFTYYSVIQESDPLNLLIFVAAFWALAVGRDLWLVPLLLAGTLNRETTAMLPVVYLLARWGQEPPRRVIGRAALFAACWGVVYGAIWLGYGNRAYYTDVVMLEANLRSLLPTTFALLFLGVMWFLPWFARQQAPLLLRRSLWLVPLFVALQYVVAVVQEVRLFLPLTPILIPLSWWVLFPEAVLKPTPEQAKRWGNAEVAEGAHTLIVLGGLLMSAIVWIPVWVTLLAVPLPMGVSLIIVRVMVPMGVILVIAGVLWHLSNRRPH